MFIPYDVAAKALGCPTGNGALYPHRRWPGCRRRYCGSQSAFASAPVRAYSWREVSADFLAMSESEAQIMGVFLGLILLIGIVGVVNTVLLGAMERVKEIGTMSHGTPGTRIIMEFARSFRNWSVGLLGEWLSAPCSTGFCGRWDGPHLLFGDMSVGYPHRKHSLRVEPADNGAELCHGVLICLVASYLPARAAAVKDPIRRCRLTKGGTDAMILRMAIRNINRHRMRFIPVSWLLR